jgi:hypothetical protein
VQQLVLFALERGDFLVKVLRVVLQFLKRKHELAVELVLLLDLCLLLPHYFLDLAELLLEVVVHIAFLLQLYSLLFQCIVQLAQLVDDVLLPTVLLLEFLVFLDVHLCLLLLLHRLKFQLQRLYGFVLVVEHDVLRIKGGLQVLASFQ